MFCNNCGHKTEAGERFCTGCGSPLAGRAEARRGMSNAKLAAIIGACIVGIIAIVIVAAPSLPTLTPGPGPVGPVGPRAADERQVKELVIRYFEAWNEGDYLALYDMWSPTYRETYLYPEFRQGCMVLHEILVLWYGTNQILLDGASTRVEIEGEWAFVTYRLWIGETEIDHADLGLVTVWQKVDGRWYAATGV